MSEMDMEGREPDAFEWQLTQAMRRVDAPEGFAARVMERTAQQGTRVQEIGPGAPKVLAMRPRFGAMRIPAWAGGAIAAVLVLGMFGAEQLHVRHERAALAQQQFEIATRITDKALEHTREQLARAGVFQDEE